MQKILFLLAIIFTFSCRESQKLNSTNDVAKKVASANGADNFSKIKYIDFTFNTQKIPCIKAAVGDGFRKPMKEYFIKRMATQ